MTTEQRKAIEYLEDMANNQKDLNKSGYVCASEKIDTVLSLIKEQQEEIVKYKNMIEEHKKQLKKSGIYGYDYDLKID